MKQSGIESMNFMREVVTDDPLRNMCAAYRPFEAAGQDELFWVVKKRGEIAEKRRFKDEGFALFKCDQGLGVWLSERFIEGKRIRKVDKFGCIF